MRIILASLLVAASLSGASGSELRGSLPSQASSNSDWSGVYVGLGVSYSAFTDTDDRFPGFVSKGDGIGFTGVAGFNQQYGSLVVGVEADWTVLQADFHTLPPLFPTVRVNDIATLRARLGYDAGAFMPYVTAGAAYATTNIAGEDTGLALGAGVDYKIKDNIIFGVLYQRHNWKKFDGAPIDVDNDMISSRVTMKF